MPAQYTQASYQGIVDAFNTLRESQGVERKTYDSNYRGIIEAILDLKKWGQAGDGDIPPGWDPIYDEDGNIIGGNWNPPPDNGTLWFDERQGRLFVWVDDGFYQTNGGDGLPHVGENPPMHEVVGSLWFNTNTQVLYLYDGQNWTIVSSEAGATTANLMLADPTVDSFRSNRPYLPDSDGLLTQKDYNVWIHSALEKLEETLEEQAGVFQVYMADTPPSEAVDGDLWYNTSRLQMLVRYDGAWVASAIPLVLDDNFVELTNTVEDNRVAAERAVANTISLIERVASRPERVFGLNYDVNEDAIQLSDSKGAPHQIKLKGVNGIDVNVTPTGIQFDASTLQNALETLQLTVASGANVAAISDRLSTVEGNVSTLLNQPTVSPSSFSALQETVSHLPTADDVSGRLSLLGGTLEGPLTMNGSRVLEVGQPVNHNDAARKTDVDAVKAYADSSFLRKDLGIIGHLAISKADATRPVFDFSSNAVNAHKALKMRTYGGLGNFATFGTTENQWEYAWNYGSNEDFCWVHDTAGKQVSISKDGLTAKKLTVGTFLPNDSNGTVVMNKIDVGATLQTIKSALQSSTSFEEFKAQVLASI